MADIVEPGQTLKNRTGQFQSCYLTPRSTKTLPAGYKVIWEVVCLTENREATADDWANPYITYETTTLDGSIILKDNNGNPIPKYQFNTYPRVRATIVDEKGKYLDSIVRGATSRIDPTYYA